jgi:hypothetical protein
LQNIFHASDLHATMSVQVRAAELGMSSRQMVQTYAKEAATLLLAEVERYTLPLEMPAGVSHSGNGVDMQQLSLNEFSGGLRSIQTAPSGQHKPSRPHDAAWGWLVPGKCADNVLKGPGTQQLQHNRAHT